MEGFLHKQRGLKEQLEASRVAERAAREEVLALQGQVKNLKSLRRPAGASQCRQGAPGEAEPCQVGADQGL